MARPRSKLPVAETLAQAAALTSLPEEALSWAKNVKGCTAFRGPRVRIAELKEWWEENKTEWEQLNNSGLPPEDILDRQLKQQKLERQRREDEIEAGKYVLKTEVCATLAAIGAEQQCALLALPRELAPRLQGADAITMQEMLEASVARVIDIFQHGAAKYQLASEWFYEI